MYRIDRMGVGEVTLKQIKLKQHWTDREFRGAKLLIMKWINSRPWQSSHPMPRRILTITDLDNTLGLAYTSSGRSAYLGICNIALYLDTQNKYRVSGFEACEDGLLHAVCYDDEDNELCVPLGYLGDL